MPAKSDDRKLSNVDELVIAVETLFADINIGLLIYHMEDPSDESKLKLICANRMASEYTETELAPRVGKYIFDAFPGLVGTDLPQVYMDVAKKREACLVGVVEYADPTMRQGAYSVKAFPMPANCIGVIFEDMAIRKQVDELVRIQTHALREKCRQLEEKVAEISNIAEDLAARCESVKEITPAGFSSEGHRLLDEMVETTENLKRVAGPV